MPRNGIRAYVKLAWDDFGPFDFAVHGGASGYDTAADEALEHLGYSRIICPANWNGHANSAGYIRNNMMAKLFNPRVVLAFPGGKGTKNMVNLCNENGARILRVTK